MEYIFKLILGTESETGSRLKTISYYIAIWILCIELAVYCVKSKGYTIVSLDFDLNTIIKLFSEYYIFGAVLLVGGIYYTNYIAVTLFEYLFIGLRWIYLRVSSKRRKELLDLHIAGLEAEKIKVRLNYLVKRRSMDDALLRIGFLLWLSVETIVKQDYSPFYSELFPSFTVAIVVSAVLDFSSSHYLEIDINKRLSDLTLVPS